jgi:hypothetical protein
MIPPTRYIDAGPGVALANPQASMAQGQANARMGATIAAIGAKGFEVAEKVRKMDEGAKIAEFMRQNDEQAENFSNSLMLRHDTEKWPSDWNSKTSTMRDSLSELGLSPEGRARAEMELADWTSKRAIEFEGRAAIKTVGMARAKYTNTAEYHFGRGELEKGRETLRAGAEVGVFNPVELEEGLRMGDQIDAKVLLDEDIKANPLAALARLESGEFLENNPGADLDLVARGKRQAQAKFQEYRAGEMDTLEGKLNADDLKASDIKAARFLTDEDRADLAGAMAQKAPPSNEQHAKAWEPLALLREARTDPRITPEAYRTIWNETRGIVLRGIAPRWQGDIKKELSYLSPAGRSPDGGGLAGGYTMADLEAEGRAIAFRARDAGLFGTIAEDAKPADREKAFRKAEDVRLEVKRWLSTQRETTPEKVREYTDNLISGDRVKSTARELQSFVPGTGQSLRSKPAPAIPTLPPKKSARDKANPDPLEIPPGDSSATDALLPARRLESFIK